MKYKVTTKTDAWGLINAAYTAVEEGVAELCGDGSQFPHITDHSQIEDIAATLIVRDVGLLGVVVDALSRGNVEEANDTIEAATLALASVDRDLFERPITDLRELWRLTIKTQGGDADRDPDPKSDYEGKIGRRDESELWFWIRDRMDWTERRRWLYDLRKQAAAKVKAKRAKKADAHE